MLRNRVFLIYWLLLLTASFSLAQSPTMEQLVGTWIGELVEVDMGWVQPLPWRMTFRADSTVQLALMANGEQARTVRWQVSNRAVQLDTVRFGAAQWVLVGDQLRLNGWQPQRYRRLTNSPMDSATVRRNLVNRTWSTDSLSYSLFDDGSVCLKNHRTGNTALHYWHLVPVETSIFLVVKGTHREPNGITHFPLQITKLDASMLTVRGWNGQRWGEFSLVRTGEFKPGQHCQPEGFQLCSTFLAPAENRYPYFEYKRGRLGAIRRLVAANFVPLPDVKQSGLVRFRFVVNCEGKAGMFEMQTVDENYERCQFDTRLTDQLRRIVQERITEWEPGKGVGNDTHNTYDTHCLLTFRFKDGQIVEIFP
jgi:hypothetical protein